MYRTINVWCVFALKVTAASQRVRDSWAGHAPVHDIEKVIWTLLQAFLTCYNLIKSLPMIDDNFIDTKYVTVILHTTLGNICTIHGDPNLSVRHRFCNYFLN